MMTTAGAPFWSGTKRAPVPVVFDAMVTLHYDFIVAASNLQATVYGLKGCQDRSLFMDVLRTMEVPIFQPKVYSEICTFQNSF
jgi:ubiquitin-activating enzyme E1